ncbi:hypothetical protein ACH82I_11825 [Brevibacterium sp. GP-SGM9]|uniref:hypothetical protein n=1 Tax=Brevibacterium sp. GP-SGM9 TaxID=3376990 RepID=UPI0039A6250E
MSRVVLVLELNSELLLGLMLGLNPELVLGLRPALKPDPNSGLAGFCADSRAELWS